ncbi:MAG TPA: hypothetical protein VF743_03555, partial [Acidimicrobiales bacterium]
DTLDAIRARGRVARRRRRVAVAVAGVAAAVVVALVLPGGDEDAGRVDMVDRPSSSTTTAPTTATSDTTSTTAASSTTTTTAGEAPAAPAPTGSDGGTTPSGIDYQRLWPFATAAQADQWREVDGPAGQQPWHLSAEDTALGFTTGYLGFTEIDRVTSTDIAATDAHVGVGYANPDGGGTSTAAIIHLMKFVDPADAATAPWEVVGTSDTTLTLDTPDYASTVSGTVTAGGLITGVDESLLLQVRQASSAAPLGESCCVPAGGQETPWQATVTISGATDDVLTIVVSTGGHVQGVERFAITGVRRG